MQVPITEMKNTEQHNQEGGGFNDNQTVVF